VYRWLGLSVLITALSGCTVLPAPSPQDVYRLPPSTLSAADQGSVDQSLSILRPRASGALGSARIVVIPQDHRISAYGGSRWSATAPVLWRDYLLDAFRKDGHIDRLSGDNEDVRTDWELGGVLRSFHTEYREGEPHVVIEFDARLVDARSRQIAASRHFSVVQAVEGEQVPQVVEAFGRAADTMARQITDWTVQQLASAGTRG
ncbi:MAG: ABC-type transport auxiliary lipoprotein family protein, partial [Halofilum sp. (in: g-proteobacteria)]